MEFLKEFTHFLRARKKFWLIPILILGVAIAVLLFMAQGTALAPFIYTLF